MKDNTAAYNWGIFWSFVSAFLWSTTFIGGRYLLKDRSVDPVTLSLFRFAGGGALLLGLGIFLFGGKMFALKAKDWLGMGVLSLFGIVGMSLFLFWGQQYTGAINTSMLIAAGPIFIMLGGVFIGEKITRWGILSVCMGLIGSLLVIGVIDARGFNYEPSGFKGDFLVLCSAFCWSMYSILSKSIVNRIGGYIYTTWTMLLGSAVMLAITIFNSDAVVLPKTSNHWLVIVYLAIFPTGLAFFAYNEAMDRIKLSLLNVMQYLTPLFTVAFAFVMLGEKMTLLSMGGAALIISGVALPSLSRYIRKF